MDIRVYYTAVDLGDGSCGVEFFDSKEAIDFLEEHFPEDYRGEGGGSFLVQGAIFYIDIQTMDDIKKRFEIDDS